MHPHSNINYSQPLNPDSLPPLDHENNLSDDSDSEDGDSEEIVHSDSESNDDYWLQILISELVDLRRRENGLQQLPQKSDEFKGVGDVERLDTRKGHAQGELDILEIRPDVGLSLV